MTWPLASKRDADSVQWKAGPTWSGSRKLTDMGGPTTIRQLAGARRAGRRTSTPPHADCAAYGCGAARGPADAADTVLDLPVEAPFVGRKSELDALDVVLDQARVHGARVVLVRGKAGIGKTTLLRRFCDGHDDLRVLWGSSDESCPGASFALIGQLFRSMGIRGHRLPAHSGRTQWAEEPIEVGRRLLQVLSGLGPERPTAVVVDDAQRVDLDSLRALLFALRRLSDHPVMTVLVTPSDPVDLPDGLVRLAECRQTGFGLPLGPLQPAEVQDLATAFGVPDLSLHDASRACAHTQGNPRQMIALLTELPSKMWGRPAMLPAPRQYSRTISRKLDACTAEARRLVEVVSVLGEPADLSAAGVLADVDEPLVALEEAGWAGLLTIPQPASPWHLSFPEPLVGAAVYGQLGAARCAEMHLAAAALIDDERAAVFHREAARSSGRR